MIINDGRRLLYLTCSSKFSWVSERTSLKINRSLDRRPKKIKNKKSSPTLSPGPKKFEQHRFERRQIITLPGVPTRLRPALPSAYTMSYSRHPQRNI